MSTGFVLLCVVVVFYYSMGIGTALKHKPKLKHIPYYTFLLPAKAFVKTFALLPIIASLVGNLHVYVKVKGRPVKENEDLQFTINYDYFL